MEIFEVEEKRESVKREPYLRNEMLAEHIKEVGRRIIDDAEAISSGSEIIFGIKIIASINPGEEVTSVCYETQKYADPRINRKKECRDESH